MVFIVWLMVMIVQEFFYITGHWLGLVVWPRNAVSLCLNGTDLGMICGDRRLLFHGVLQDFALLCVVLV